MVNSKLKLILASASPRRRELLGHLNIPFEIKTLNVAEESSHTDPAHFSLEIARLKGIAVREDLIRSSREENFLIVSADTVVSLGNKIYGKPSGREESRQFLSDLSGRTHSVYTAVSIFLYYHGQRREHSFVDEVKVTFEVITPVLMENYLNTGDSLDKAGAYGIQGPSLTFISRVEGSYSTVVGFPLSRFSIEIEKFLRSEFPEVSSWFNLF